MTYGSLHVTVYVCRGLRKVNKPSKSEFPSVCEGVRTKAHQEKLTGHKLTDNMIFFFFFFLKDKKLTDKVYVRYLNL